MSYPMCAECGHSINAHSNKYGPCVVCRCSHFKSEESGGRRTETAAERFDRNTRAVELMKRFIQACEVPAEEDWSADRHRPEAATL